MTRAWYKESRYLKSGNASSVHYYVFREGSGDYHMSLDFANVLPDLLQLGAEGYKVDCIDHPDIYTTVVDLIKE